LLRASPVAIEVAVTPCQRFVGSEQPPGPLIEEALCVAPARGAPLAKAKHGDLHGGVVTTGNRSIRDFEARMRIRAKPAVCGCRQTPVSGPWNPHKAPAGAL
jgi:hypothetical protein